MARMTLPTRKRRIGRSKYTLVIIGVTFLIPVSAIVLGVSLLGERLELALLALELGLDGRGGRRRPGLLERFGFLGRDRPHELLEVGLAVLQSIDVEAETGERAGDALEVGLGRNVVPLRKALDLGRASRERGRGAVLVQHRERAQHLPDRLVERRELAALDPEGGPGALDDADLAWALDRLQLSEQPVDDDGLAAALALPSGSPTPLTWITGDGGRLTVERVDVADAPAAFGFQPEPRPLRTKNSAQTPKRSGPSRPSA